MVSNYKNVANVLAQTSSQIQTIVGTECVCVLPQVFVCLWKGCKVYNTPSTSQSWLQRHMLSHSGDKPFKVTQLKLNVFHPIGSLICLPFLFL